MTTALLLVDLQRDYLARPGIVPAADVVVAGARALLEAFRATGAPVAHIRTVVRADGTDAMPHWRGALACVDGTEGALPPAGLEQAPGELVAVKQHYRGFADPRLDPWLRDAGVTHVVIAGVYTHACVRETALDAYERGFTVTIAEDAVGTDSPAHADLTRQWLESRAATFASTPTIIEALPAQQAPPLLTAAAQQAAAAQPAWAATSPAHRAALLLAWADELQRRSPDLVRLIVADVRKPVALAEDEVRRAIGHVRAAAALLDTDPTALTALDAGVGVRRRPVGVVAAILPWNNPVALACGKIAPALALGNAVVLKPAPQGTAAAHALLDSLLAAGNPAGLVGIVEGGAHAGAALARDPRISAVTVTGSIVTGRALAAECARLWKPLQAELGGNNAAVVLADADLDTVVPELVRSAFAYSGQRCTAIRRFVVDERIVGDFTARAVAIVADLRLGDPADATVDLGPLISPEARERVANAVSEALDSGAELLTGGDAPATGDHYPPTLLLTRDPAARIVQEETFGPVAVIQPATDLEHAVTLANGVEQGLVLAVCTRDAAAAAQVLDRAEAGIVQWGSAPVPVHADAPFGGWKASGFGPPEHGVWDVDFLTRPQAVYGPVAFE